MAALGMDSFRDESAPSMFDGHDGRPDPSTPAPSPGASADELFVTALNLVVDHQNASASWLQRQMRIGYNRASKLIEDLEKRGVVGPPNHVGKRDVLVAPEGEVAPSKTGRSLKQRVGAAVLAAAKTLDDNVMPMTVSTGDGQVLFENKAAREQREGAST
ncbi:DNA translocase FtsK [Sphingobium yanoikuyae]